MSQDTTADVHLIPLIVPQHRHAWQGWLGFDYSVQVCESSVPAVLIAVVIAESHSQGALQENKKK